MSSLPPYHEQATVGQSASTTADTTTSNTQHLSSKAHTTSDHAVQDDRDTISAAPAATHNSLNREHELSSSTSQPRGSLSTTDDVSKQDTQLTSSVGQQSAPGRAGSIGDKTLGALGFGGSKVERPKEDQGLGEKIVNFLGA